MKIINYILISFLLIIPQIKIFATSQVSDKLIYNGDTLYIFSNPLEQYFANLSIRPDLFGDKVNSISSACWRGYIAEWSIIEDNLYLTEISNCCYSEDSVKADLKELFGNKFVNGKVKADWFTGNILSPHGKLLFHINMGYASIYEKELELEFLKGKLVGTKTLDNSKSRKSEYSQNSEKLDMFIYSNINWSILPKMKKKAVKVFVNFSANENGIIDSVKVMKDSDTVFAKEAVRVVKTIPVWDICYRRGMPQRADYALLILFSDENRKKYNISIDDKKPGP